MQSRKTGFGNSARGGHRPWVTQGLNAASQSPALVWPLSSSEAFSGSQYLQDKRQIPWPLRSTPSTHFLSQPNGPLSFSLPFVQGPPSSPPFCKLPSVQRCPPTQTSCDGHAARSAQKCQAAGQRVLRGDDTAEAASRNPALPPSLDYGERLMWDQGQQQLQEGFWGLFLFLCFFLFF